MPIGPPRVIFCFVFQVVFPEDVPATMQTSSSESKTNKDGGSEDSGSVAKGRTIFFSPAELLLQVFIHIIEY